MSKDIKHHLTSELLMAYASGTLPEAFNLLVAAHISVCDQCRAEADSYDAIGGELLDRSDILTAPLHDDSFAQTLALIAGSDGVSARVQPTEQSAQKTRVLPVPLRDYVGGGLNDVKWKSIGMGVKQAVLPTSDTASARLLFIPAGAAMPHHGHQGMEMTMVLQGAFQDEEDYFGPGDVEIADADLHHTPVADIHEDCICLAVTDAPLKFRGLLPRLAQPFLGI